jgi:hypothetical protein
MFKNAKKVVFYNFQASENPIIFRKFSPEN